MFTRAPVVLSFIIFQYTYAEPEHDLELLHASLSALEQKISEKNEKSQEEKDLLGLPGLMIEARFNLLRTQKPTKENCGPIKGRPSSISNYPQGALACMIAGYKDVAGEFGPPGLLERHLGPVLTALMKFENITLDEGGDIMYTPKGKNAAMVLKKVVNHQLTPTLDMPLRNYLTGYLLGYTHEAMESLLRDNTLKGRAEEFLKKAYEEIEAAK